jgi:hypothetical protein
MEGIATAADADDRRNAVSSYNSRLNAVSDALRRHAHCVGGSKGQNDCSSEFRRLRSAQDDFERAVRGVRDACA